MKKSVFLILVFLVFCPVWRVEAAATSNLLSGVVFGGKETAGWTDGNESVMVDATSPSGGYYYTFPEVVDISRIRYVGAASNYGITFYGPDGKTISPVTYITVSTFDENVSFKNVKSMRFARSSGYTSFSLKEISIYGGKYVPENTDVSKFVINDLKYKVEKAGTSLVLDWAAISSSFFQNYNVYQDGVLLSKTINNTFSVSGLVPGKIYKYTVKSVDILDKEFDGSSVSHTVPIPDTTPPGIPILSGDSGDSKSELRWNESQDEDIAGFMVYQDGRKIATVGIVTKYVVTGLKNDNSYKFRITAYDKSGNESGLSNEITLTPKSTPPPVTDTEQEAKDGYLLVTWKKTEGATGYRVYLNGRLVGTVGPDVLEYKITRDMGYNPANLVNRAEARAVMADGTEGGSNNPTSPGEGVLDDALSFLKIDDMIATSLAFLAIYAPWIILILAVIFSPVLYGLVVKLMNYSRRKTDVPAVKGTVLNPYEKRR